MTGPARRWVPLTRTRAASAAVMFALAIALVARGDAWSVAAGAVVAVDVLVRLLPWRVPRRDRSATGYWLETAAYTLPFAAVVAAGAIASAPWLTSLPSAWWLAAAVPAGALLVRLSGIDLGLLVRGDLAFLAPPSRRSHAIARTTADVSAPPLEEAVFRGAAAGTPAISPGLAVLSGAAFVARHHVTAGSAERMSRRVLATEIAGAIVFTALAWASGSIYPGMLAHAVANLPVAVLDIQVAKSTGVH